MSNITYCIVDSPIGRLLLAATTDDLVRIAFDCEGFDAVLDALTAETVTESTGGTGDTAPSPELDAAATQLEEYFDGTRRDFDLPLSLPGHSFRRTAQPPLRDIPYGETRTYAQLAETAGNPKAVRAVGSACASNPLPVVVPCHRVLRSDGGIGGYLGGADAKKFLLSLEQTS